MNIYREGTLKEVESLIDFDLDLPFDVETDGLYGRIELAQFYQHDWEQVILVRRPDPLLLAVLLGKTRFVAHVASYEISTIQAQLGAKWVPKRVEDTMYLARLQYPTKHEFSLDKTYTYVLGYDPYEKAWLDKKVMQKSNWAAPVLTDDQKLYAALDVYYMPAVLDACTEARAGFSYRLDMLALGYAVDFQQNGFPVEVEKVRQQYSDNLAKIAEYNCPINVNSWKQVRPYIGSNMSDGLGLATLTLQGNKEAEEVQAVRKLIKQNSFLAKFDVEEGRIYGKFAPSARSGRFTCKDQNLEQLPRETKGCFGVGTETGRVIVYSDYSGLELRAACAIINEPTMEKLFREGADLHDYVASMIFGKDFTPAQRQLTKTYNFNLLYGGGWKMLQGILIQKAGVLIPQEQLQADIRKWKNLFRAVKAWQQRGIDAQRRGQIWSTPLGRRYVGKLMTDQLNIQVSGFGAEVAKLAMHYMYPKLKAINACAMVNFIHDSYLIECNIEDAEQVAKIVGESMKEAWFEASKSVAIKDLPMPIVVLTGYNWGDIEKGDYLGSYKC